MLLHPASVVLHSREVQMSLQSAQLSPSTISIQLIHFELVFRSISMGVQYSHSYPPDQRLHPGDPVPRHRPDHRQTSSSHLHVYHQLILLLRVSDPYLNKGQLAECVDRTTFNTKQWPLDHRITFMQERTAYMIGFGKSTSSCLGESTEIAARQVSLPRL